VSNTLCLLHCQLKYIAVPSFLNISNKCMSSHADHGLERKAITKLSLRPVDNTLCKTRTGSYTSA